MYVISHALMPVIPCLCANLVDRKVFPWWALVVVAFAGVLPDVLNPHIYLSDRLTSWSHSVWALYAIGLFTFLSPLRYWHAVAVTFAYALHLVGDAITGGIAPAYPANPAVVGCTLIDSSKWVLLDLLNVLAVGGLLVLVKLRTRRNVSEYGG